MKYEALVEALKIHGMATGVDELSNAQLGPPKITMAIPRPRGIMLISSSARITGGALDGGFVVTITKQPFGSEASGEPNVYLTGYKDAEAAFLDIQRTIVLTAIKDETIEAISGWAPTLSSCFPGSSATT